jgi:hypothetical protein
MPISGGDFREVSLPESLRLRGSVTAQPRWGQVTTNAGGFCLTPKRVDPRTTGDRARRGLGFQPGEEPERLRLVCRPRV